MSAPQDVPEIDLRRLMRASVLSQGFWTWGLKERLLSIWMPRSLEEGEDEGIILWLLQEKDQVMGASGFFGVFGKDPELSFVGSNV